MTSPFNPFTSSHEYFCHQLFAFSLRFFAFSAVNLFFLFSAPSHTFAQSALKQAFSDMFLIGAALNPSQFLEENTNSSALVKAQFNSISPENVLKWEAVHPRPDTYNFEPAD